MCFGNLYGTSPNHSCLSTLQMKRGSAPLLYGDKERVITQEVFKNVYGIPLRKREGNRTP